VIRAPDRFHHAMKERGFSHDMADLLFQDLERQLPTLQNQPAPVHSSSTATGFHH
jgi:glutamate decarboxylase